MNPIFARGSFVVGRYPERPGCPTKYGLTRPHSEGGQPSDELRARVEGVEGVTQVRCGRLEGSWVVTYEVALVPTRFLRRIKTRKVAHDVAKAVVAAVAPLYGE